MDESDEGLASGGTTGGVSASIQPASGGATSSSQPYVPPAQPAPGDATIPPPAPRRFGGRAGGNGTRRLEQGGQRAGLWRQPWQRGFSRMQNKLNKLLHSRAQDHECHECDTNFYLHLQGNFFATIGPAPGGRQVVSGTPRWKCRPWARPTQYVLLEFHKGFDGRVGARWRLFRGAGL